MVKILKESDKKFLNFNKRNILVNLLQAENHARNMQTLNFKKGEGSCFLKHLLFVKGEVEEAMNATSHLEPKNFKIFEKIKEEMEEFFEEVESENHDYTKMDLINLVRKWRKLVESTTPWYKTFECKCLHSIPYFKTLLYFLSGIILASILNLIF